MTLSAGDRVDRFTVEALLGRGGMGVVYRAFDTRLGRRVAIKLLDGLSADAPARARFDREARLIASLDHPAAVHVYEAGESEGTPYIVMELIEGVTLRVAAATQPDWRMKLGWLVEAAEALVAAHEAGLVHRDVKPDNIMVRPDGRVKVLDFGIARRVRVAGETVGETVTAEGTIVGTPRYMAPEQLRNEPLDGRADQFAWGVTAYEALSGRSPWGDSEDAVSLISHILGSPAPPLLGSVPDLPAEVESVLARTLAKERGARFSTMREVTDALAFVRGVPLATASGGNAADASAPTIAAPIVVTPRVTPEALAATEELRGPAASTGPVVQPLAATRSVAVPLALAFLVVAGAGLWAAKRSPATTPVAATSASATASAATVPVSPNPEAARLYAEGNEIWRTDSDMAGLAAWQRAVEADPGLCQAQVRLAVFGSYADIDAAGAYEAARACASKLGATDLALLDAIAPLVARPVDEAAYIAATARAAKAFPDDPYIGYLRGGALAETDPVGSIAAYDHAIDVDPRFVHAYDAKAQVLESLGRRAEAEETLATCSAASPGSILCGYRHLMLLNKSGKCGEGETLARRFVAQRPSNAAGYSWLAGALASRGAPLEAVEVAVEQTQARETPGTTGFYRARTEWLEGAKAAYGDFPGALDLLDERDRGDSKLTDVASRENNVLRRVQILREAGRTDDARGVLRTFLRQSEAYQRTYEGDLVDAVAESVLLGMQPASVLVEATSRPKGYATPDVTPTQRWVGTYVWSDPPPAFARIAVANMPGAEELRALQDSLSQSDPPALLPIGITFARGGHPEMAVPWLRAGLHACMALFPEALVRRHAELELGKALEAAGDKAGAREQYESILRYLGAAKPRSVTADEARKRLATLGP